MEIGSQTFQLQQRIQYGVKGINSYLQVDNYFVSPQQVMQGLIRHNPYPCDCGKSTNHQQSQSDQHFQRIDREQIITDIEKMQDNLNNMDNEVVEVQNMLTVRDSLYQQLDQLRIDRQQIQQQIIYIQEHSVSQVINKNIQGQEVIIKEVRNNPGIKEMNQRLRRRILQVRQYIEKMDIQNQRIQQAILHGATRQEIYETDGQNRHRYRRYHNRSEPALNQHQHEYYYRDQHKDYSFAKTNQYFEDLRKRMQNKQEEAWMRLRSQQQQIAQRNRTTFNKINDMYANSHSPRFHTTYGRI